MSFQENGVTLQQSKLGIGKRKKTVFLCIVVLLLLLSFLAEPLLFMKAPYVRYHGEHTTFQAGEGGQISSYQYAVVGNDYLVNGNDPQLLIGSLSHPIRYVVFQFEDVQSKGTPIEVFYGNGGFSEKDKVQWTVSYFTDQLVMAIPEGNYTDLRVDINRDFSLKSLTVADANTEWGTAAVEPFRMARVVTLFALLLVVFLVFLYCRYRKPNPRHLCSSEMLFLALCFALYTAWTVLAPHNYAPDEAMRFDVTQFLFDHDRLPVGDELVHAQWGFSYAHLPAVLCNTLGYLFMKVASIFTSNSHLLLVAARMVSTVSATLAVYYVIKITKLLFHSFARWIMIFFFALIPQLCFLSSYVNNDSLAVLGTTMIVYAWVLAIKDHWTYKASLVLVVGIAICALAYYNSYAWILVSVFFFLFSYFKQNPKNYAGFAKLAGFMIVLTLLLIGYSFIRHLVVYGDLLGIETSHKYGELFAPDGMRPSERLSLNERGVGLKEMLFSPQYRWVQISCMSFVGLFGYMQFGCPDFVYSAFMLFFVLGAVGFAAKLIGRIFKRQKVSYHTVLLYVCMLACAIITVMLSIYNSYNTDFQPQGRYCYPALITVALVLAKGFETLIGLLKREEHRRVAVAVVCTVIATVSLVAFDTAYLGTIM